MGDNQAINRVRVDSSKMRNRGAFSGSLAALLKRPYIFKCFTQMNDHNSQFYIMFIFQEFREMSINITELMYLRKIMQDHTSEKIS